jgi:hypothetical protein
MGPAPHPVDDAGRLDPPFVEWMMGFPQGWTEGMSRTQALKALGNAVVPQQAVAAISSFAPIVAECDGCGDDVIEGEPHDCPVLGTMVTVGR